MNGNNKKILGIHLGLVLAEMICVSGFVFEFIRARSGNELSWAYVFEWPIFGWYAVHMWRKLLHEAREGVDSPTTTLSAQSDDALRAYNAYLRDVHEIRSRETPDSSVSER